MQRAKLCIPINNAASSKHYTNSTGAALRVRELNKKRGNFYGKIREHRLQQCSHYVQQQVEFSINPLIRMSKKNFRFKEKERFIFQVYAVTTFAYHGHGTVPNICL